MSARAVKPYIRAVLWWGIASVILLVIAAGVLSSVNCGAKAVALTSSAISLLAGIAAGTAAKSGVKGGALTGGIISVLIIAIGLALGSKFSEMNGLVSAVPFTVSGALIGGLSSQKRRKHRRHR